MCFYCGGSVQRAALGPRNRQTTYSLREIQVRAKFLEATTELLQQRTEAATEHSAKDRDKVRGPKLPVPAAESVHEEVVQEAPPPPSSETGSTFDFFPVDNSAFSLDDSPSPSSARPNLSDPSDPPFDDESFEGDGGFSQQSSPTRPPLGYSERPLSLLLPRHLGSLSSHLPHLQNQLDPSYPNDRHSPIQPLLKQELRPSEHHLPHLQNQLDPSHSNDRKLSYPLHHKQRQPFEQQDDRMADVEMYSPQAQKKSDEEVSTDLPSDQELDTSDEDPMKQDDRPPHTQEHEVDTSSEDDAPQEEQSEDEGNQVSPLPPIVIPKPQNKQPLNQQQVQQQQLQHLQHQLQRQQQLSGSHVVLPPLQSAFPPLNLPHLQGDPSSLYFTLSKENPRVLNPLKNTNISTNSTSFNFNDSNNIKSYSDCNNNKCTNSSSCSSSNNSSSSTYNSNSNSNSQNPIDPNCHISKNFSNSSSSSNSSSNKCISKSKRMSSTKRSNRSKCNSKSSYNNNYNNKPSYSNNSNSNSNNNNVCSLHLSGLRKTIRLPHETPHFFLNSYQF
eukprot:CAMPEP_0174262454 /NCGR_PEP_ID=MMETSP0439-20130205/12985_1 /TAXON_ID=0 /ORGANISM="Stereomyxa ramosa, Strain Chinc5" /LENGTH=554 /DNA_ID=CAMNT_0015347163 /DNA_START=683 /DNA_END=2349 /DNA_ORIENTATION=-